MPTDSRLLDFEQLSSEQRQQLARLLPLELQRHLSKIAGPTRTEQEQMHTQLAALLNVLHAMVPRWLIDDLDLPEPPSAYSFEASLLFIDVSGFTRITKKLSKRPYGNEVLTRLLNTFFTRMVAIASSWGGDVLAFGGDALLVAYSGHDHPLVAAAAACSMQAAMEAFAQTKIEGESEVFPLKMKIGMASGPLVLTSVGTSERRMPLMLGMILATTDAMAHDLIGDQIRLDPQAAAAVASSADLSFHPDRTAFLTRVYTAPQPFGRPPLPEPHSLPMSVQIDQATRLTTYLPRSIVNGLVAAPNAAPGVGEQRQVLSLFVHLTGLNILTDALGVLQAPRMVQIASLVLEKIVAVIEQNGGVLVRVDTYNGGHKLLALFGAPNARENDTYWAVHSALELHAVVRQANAEIAEILGIPVDGQAIEFGNATIATHPATLLNTRCGITSGRVVAGMVGSPTREEYTVMGDSVNMAARMMGTTELADDKTLISSDVRQQIRAPLGAIPRKFTPRGSRDPIEVWSIQWLGPKPPRKLKLTPLVGREDQQRHLKQIAEAFQRGNCRVLFLRGEAGIGKSRLSHELRALLGGNAKRVVVNLSLQIPHGYAFVERLVYKIYALTGSHDGSVDGWLARLERQSTDDVELRMALGFLLRLKGVDHRRLGENAEALQRALARALHTLLQITTQQHPLALFFENLHKADQQSIDLLERLFLLMQENWHGPLLLCATMRPQPDRERGGDRMDGLIKTARRCFAYQYRTITLDSLGPQARADLLRSLLPNLVPSTSAILLDRAGGNPLFQELLIEAINEPGKLLNGPHGLELRDSLDALDIPADLNELVVSLLDGLRPEARRLACTAAVLTALYDSFEFWLLEAVVGDVSEIEQAWAELLDSQVVLARPPGQDKDFAFRHPLFQQQAYQLLQYYDQWELHRRAGAALERLKDDSSFEQYIDAIAHHAYEGHDWNRALKYSLEVGLRAYRLYDQPGARRSLRRAVALARGLRLPREEAMAREALGALYTLMSRYTIARLHLKAALRKGAFLEATSDQIEAQARRRRLLARIEELTGNFEQAERDCRNGLMHGATLALPNTEIARLHEQLACVLSRVGRLPAARDACNAGLAALPHGPATLRERVTLWLRLAMIDINDGRSADTLPVLKQCLRLAREMGDKTLTAQVLYHLGSAYRALGKPDQAQAHYQESLAIRESIGDTAGRIEAFNGLGLVHLATGQAQTALECFTESLKLCERLGMPNHQATALINIGQLQLEQGLLDEARASLVRACAIYESLGNLIGTAHCRYLLGDIALMRGDGDAAQREGQRALDLARQIPSEALESCALRVIGEAHRIKGQIVEAKAYLAQSWQVQAKVGDPYDEALILAAQAELALVQGNREQTRDYANQALERAREQHMQLLTERLEALLGNIEGDGGSPDM